MKYILIFFFGLAASMVITIAGQSQGSKNSDVDKRIEILLSKMTQIGRAHV